MGFTPSSGDELQSEYVIPRRHAVEAIEAVRGLAGRIRPVLQVSEIRSVAADRLWMSPSYGEDTVCIHFTWKPEREAVGEVLVELEAALAPFRGAPALGQALRRRRSGDRTPLRAHAGLRRPDRAARPARGVPQLVVENPCSR
jgi:xylitol oxidase